MSQTSQPDQHASPPPSRQSAPSAHASPHGDPDKLSPVSVHDISFTENLETNLSKLNNYNKQQNQLSKLVELQHTL